MSHNQTLQTKLIQRMGLQNSSKEVQDSIIQQIALAARAKIANSTQEILSQEQLSELEAKISATNTVEELDSIAEWVEVQIPEYNELFLATVEDVVDEIVERRQQVENS